MTDISLRFTLFQRLTHLQMYLFSRILWYLLLTYLVTFVLFALLRIFTGISIGRVGYFCLRHIVFNPRQGVEVRINRLGLFPHRPTVARPGFCTFMISNLEVHIDPDLLSKAPKKKAKSTKPHRSSSSLNLEDLNIGDGVPLLPDPNSSAFKVLKWLVTHMKVFNLQLQGTSLVVHGISSIISTSIFLRLDLRKTLNSKLSNFVGTLDSYQLTKGELPINAKLSIVDVYTAQSLEDEQPWQMFEDLRFDITGVLEVEKLCVKEFGVQIHSGRLQLDVKYILDVMKRLKKPSSTKKEPEVSKEPEEKPVVNEEKAIVDANNESSKPDNNITDPKKARMLRILLQLVMRVQITIGFTEVLQIPVSQTRETAFIALSMKDLNLDLSRMNSKNSGFRINFDEDDFAHQAIFTVASFYAGLDDKNRQDEILYVPLVTSLTRTNLSSQTLKLLAGETKQNNSKIITRAVIYSPHLTLEESQFPNLIKAALGLAARFDKPKSSSNKGSHSGEKKTNFLFLPALDTDISISNPSTRLVCEHTQRCSAALFVASSSRVQLAVTAKHDSEKHAYLATADYDAYNTSVTFHSSSTEKSQILCAQKTGLSLYMNSKPTLQVEAEFRQQTFTITALTHDVFYAIAQLHMGFTKSFQSWIKKHPNFYKEARNRRAEKLERSKNDASKKVGHLRRIPKWVTRLSFMANDSNFTIASNNFRGKSTDLLGIKVTSESVNISYHRDGNPKKVTIDKTEVVDPNSTDDRLLTVAATDFNVYKADHRLLSIEDSELPNVQSHTIVQLPRLRIESRTHDSVETNTEILVEPRLKVRLNINLILAFSVLREITDLVLLRHLKEKGEMNVIPDMHKLEVDAKKMEHRPTLPKSSEHFNITVVLPRALIKIDMPSDDQVMLELNSARVSILHGSNPTLQTKALRMYSQHPFQRGAWCVLMSVVHVNAEVNKKATKENQEDKFKLNVKGMRINVPYKFKLYRIIDNGITLAKAMKTLIKQTAEQDNDIVLRPKAIVGVPNIPRVHLKTDQLVLSLEDDYFESDLTLIMLTQQNAASMRRHKLYLLETKIKTMLRKGKEALYADEKDPSAPKRTKTFGNFNIASAFQHPKRQKTFNNNGVTFSSDSNEVDNALKDKEAKEKAIKEFFINASSDTPPPESAPEEEATPAASSSNDNNNNTKHDTGPSKDAKKDEPNVDDSGRDTKEKKIGTSKSEDIPNSEKKKKIKESHEPKLSDEFIEACARTLQHVPIEKINKLLVEGLELGLPCSDGDSAIGENQPWLHFWDDPDFSEFRKLRVPLDTQGLGKLSISGAREALLHNFSRLWVDQIRNERMKQHLGVAKKRTQVFTDEFDKATCREERIVDYSQKPLTMQIDFRNLDLVIDETEHRTPEKLSEFIHQVGKGQPKDTKYSILVPLFLDLKAYGGLKIEVRDYPLPVLHFPPLARSQDPKKNCALQIKGNLIITEKLVTGEESIRRIFVPLKPVSKDDRHQRGSDVLEVNRTLTPIKTYTDLEFKSESTLPTRVCWCMAYKAGFSSVGEAFHGFSKPPIDPSPVLGFWDKIRLVFHARLVFHFPKSPLALLMKAGRTPYGLQNDDSGFLFLWRDNVHVNINKDDNPKELFKFESEKFELMVPNYVDWEAEFLHASPAERAWPRKEIIEKPEPAEKVVFSFNQPTIWKLGMSFERMLTDRDNEKVKLRSQKFRPHYDISLCMPEFVKNIAEFDSYDGFRSDFIHMSISVVSKPFNMNLNSVEAHGFDAALAPNRCTCHLTNKVLHHFSAWKDQFSSQHWPPIRSGSLFVHQENNIHPPRRTFGTSLSTAVYQIALSPLDLSFFHEMRHRSNSENYDHTSGVKAKLEDLVFDWHTRREPPEVKDNEGNDVIELHGNKRWRMRSYLGQVALQSMHVRIIKAKLRSTSSTAALRELQGDSDGSDEESDYESDSDSDATSSYNTSQHQSERSSGSRLYGPQYIDNDYWVDLDDYTDIGCWRKHRSRHPRVKVYPFMFVPRFVYLRRTDFSGNATYMDTKTGHIMPKFNDMMLHECRLDFGPKASVQNDLLKLRLSSLKEQVMNLKDSLESMESNGEIMDQDTKNKVKELKLLIDISKTNSSILEKEIKHYTNAEKHECHSSEEYIKSMRDSLESHLGKYSPKKDTVVYDGQEQDWKFGNLEGKKDGDYNNMMTFNNVYTMHAPHVRWSNNVRNVIYRLKSSLSEDKELSYVCSRTAVEYLEELVAKSQEQASSNSAKSPSSDNENEKNRSPSGHSHNPLHYAENGVTYINGKAHKLQSAVTKPLLQTVHHSSSHSVKDDNVVDSDSDEEIAEPEIKGFGECGARLNKIYRDVQKHDPQYHNLVKSHSVSLIAPRIQLISEERPDDSLQMTARTLEMQVVDVYSKLDNTESDNARIERRIGAAVGEAGFFILSREDLKRPAVASICLEQYSGNENNSETLWPPWLSIELCYNKTSMEQFMVINDTSFGVQLYLPNTMHVASAEEENQRIKEVGAAETEARNNNVRSTESTQQQNSHVIESQQDKRNHEHTKVPGINRGIARTLRRHGKHSGKSLLSNIIIDAPHLVLNIDEKQFAALYAIVSDLLGYTDPLTEKRNKAIDRVFLANDFNEDHSKTLSNIELLQKDIRRLDSLHREMLINSLCKDSATRETQVLMIKLEREIFRRQTLLIVHMRAFKASLRRKINTGWDKITKLSLLVDFLTVRMLSKSGAPLLTAHLQRLHFGRLTNDGSGSMNRFTLQGIHARNNMPKAVYPQILANYEDNKYSGIKDAVRVQWTSLEKVGGIPILECITVKLKPLHMQVEHGVFELIVDFLFPIRHSKDEGDDGASTKTKLKKKKSSTSSDSDSDSDSMDSYLDESSRARGDADHHKGLLQKIKPGRHSSWKSDVDEMVDRASNYISIRSLQIFPTQIIASYKGKHYYNLLNLHNLKISLPLYEVENRTWTKLELIMRLKHMVIKTLLAQSGSIIGNMFKVHKNSSQDQRDLSLDQLGGTKTWALEAARIDDEISRRETGDVKPKEISHRHYTLHKDHSELLRPYHRTDSWVQGHDTILKSTNTLLESDESGNFIARMPSGPKRLDSRRKSVVELDVDDSDSDKSEVSRTDAKPKKRISLQRMVTNSSLRTIPSSRTVTQHMVGSPQQLRSPSSNVEGSPKPKLLGRLKKKK